MTSRKRFRNDKALTIRLPLEVYEQIVAQAVHDQRSLNQEVLRLLRLALANRQ